VCLTGGEPHLHPNFVKIVKLLRERTNSKIILCTNGFLLSKYLDKIANCVDAYLISLDSATAEGYKNIRGVDWFETVIKLPKLIKEKNPSAYVAFSCVIQKKNFTELEDILKLANKTGADYMGFTLPTLVPGAFGWGKVAKSVKDRVIPNSSEIIKLESIIERLIRLDSKLKNIKIIQSAAGIRAYINQFRYEAGETDSPPHARCPVPFQEIVLDEKGFLRPCFILPPICKYEKDKDPVNRREMLNFRRNFYEMTTSPTPCYSCYIRLLHQYAEDEVSKNKKHR
jgi:MoaA/NifB/PqqE/SkfB family radical SAM enzyme